MVEIRLEIISTQNYEIKMASKKKGQDGEKKDFFFIFIQDVENQKNPKFLGGCDGTEKKGEHQGKR